MQSNGEVFIVQRLFLVSGLRFIVSGSLGVLVISFGYSLRLRAAVVLNAKSAKQAQRKRKV
jgi:hypothetical protein